MISRELITSGRFVSPAVVAKLEAGKRAARFADCPVWVLELRHPSFLLPECPPPAPGRAESQTLCVPAVAWPSWRAERFVLEPAPTDLRCPVCLTTLRLADVPRLVDRRGRQLHPAPFETLRPRGD